MPALARDLLIFDSLSNKKNQVQAELLVYYQDFNMNQ